MNTYTGNMVALDSDTNLITVKCPEGISGATVNGKVLLIEADIDINCISDEIYILQKRINELKKKEATPTKDVKVKHLEEDLEIFFKKHPLCR